jgi:hypothetical protein
MLRLTGQRGQQLKLLPQVHQLSRCGPHMSLTCCCWCDLDAAISRSRSSSRHRRRRGQSSSSRGSWHFAPHLTCHIHRLSNITGWRGRCCCCCMSWCCQWPQLLLLLLLLLWQCRRRPWPYIEHQRQSFELPDLLLAQP